MAYEDLDRTMYAILDSTLEYLTKKGGNIDPMTLEAHGYFKQLLESKGELNEMCIRDSLHHHHHGLLHSGL